MSPPDGSPPLLGDELEYGDHPCPNLPAVVRQPEDPEEQDDTGFDWCGDDIVCHQQPRSAVYFNPHGQVVIRQERDYHAFEDDPFVFFSVENVPALIEALRACLEPGTPKPAAAQAKLTNNGRTAADRQRRYRRHRNGVTPQRDVTP